MAGRRGLVVGIANERSIAYGIARAAHDAGAELALTYQSERLERRVRPLAGALDATVLAPCDLSDDGQIEALRERIAETWDRLDFIVHAVAFAERDDLAAGFVNTSRAGFLRAMEISVFSLVALARAFGPLLERGAQPSILTLSYLGSERALPHYNVMGVAKAALEAAVRYLAADLGPRGIRVNALSPGPIKTLSAAGVRGLRQMLQQVPQAAPLRRNVTIDDVGQAALFCLSPLGSAVTGEVIHVDAGYHAIDSGAVLGGGGEGP